MSDEDHDVDIESDEDDEYGYNSMGTQSTSYMTPAERRAHHNALERKRRDHIKESFTSLRDSVPQLHGEKVKQVSRAQILKKAADYITYMRRKNHSHQQDIDDLKRHNTVLEQQIKSLEKAKTTGQFAVTSSHSSVLQFDGSGSDSEEIVGQLPSAKKIKLSLA